MNYFLIVASDGWSEGNVKLDEKFFPMLEQKFNLRWERMYEFSFYGPTGASVFLGPDPDWRYSLGNIYENICDTKDKFLLFDHLRCLVSPSRETNSEHYLYISIGDDRIKIDWGWDPELYCYFHCIRTIRTQGEWPSHYDYFLEMEFGVNTKKEREDFMEKAKAANLFRELPLMTEEMLESIREEKTSGRSMTSDNTL